MVSFCFLFVSNAKMSYKPLLWLTLLSFSCILLISSDGQSISRSCRVPKFPNGKIKIRGRGRILKFACNPGYELVGRRIATCLRSQWSNPTPVCVAPGCSLKMMKNGYYLPTHRDALVSFYCDPGYALEGSSTLYCDGRIWNSTIPVCLAALKNPSLTCDFESPDLCGWNHCDQHEFEWTRHNFATPSGHVGTGPSYDHTLGDGSDGHYMYIEASSPRKENDTARLISPVYDGSLSTNGCFRFWYHMFGTTTGSLMVFVKPESKKLHTILPLYEKSGNQGNKWIEGVVLLPFLQENFQIVIQGVRGSSYVSDIAIDDVQLSTDTCPFVTVLPTDITTPAIPTIESVTDEPRTSPVATTEPSTRTISFTYTTEPTTKLVETTSPTTIPTITITEPTKLVPTAFETEPTRPVPTIRPIRTTNPAFATTNPAFATTNPAFATINPTEPTREFATTYKTIRFTTASKTTTLTTQKQTLRTTTPTTKPTTRRVPSTNKPTIKTTLTQAIPLETRLPSSTATQTTMSTTSTIPFQRTIFPRKPTTLKPEQVQKAEKRSDDAASNKAPSLTIVVLVVGGVLLISVVLGGAYFLHRRRKLNREKLADDSDVRYLKDDEIQIETDNSVIVLYPSALDFHSSTDNKRITMKKSR
uniref:Sushi domain-containing protein n=1 Tax=Strigamia maritima TaxID=126957 RepID=T1JBF6_STRMM